MSALLDPHIGHHIIATIAVKKLLIGWDHEGGGRPIWSVDAPDVIKKEIIKWVEDCAEEP